MNLLPSEQVKAVTEGDVDAVMVWEPFATMAKQELGSNAVSWEGKRRPRRVLVASQHDRSYREEISCFKAFSRPLAKAEDFIKNNEIESIGIMEKLLERGNLATLWRNHRFGLSLHRPFILKMEAELEWVESGPNARQSDIPDLNDFVYFDALNSVEPARIKLLH